MSEVMALTPDIIESEYPVEVPTFTDEELLTELVFFALQGYKSPNSMVKLLNIPHEFNRVNVMMRGPQYQRAVFKAKRDVTETVTERIKQRLPVYMRKMEGLALNSEDARTQVVALKDLMDRGGIGATQKVALTSPEAYRRAVIDLMEDAPQESQDGNPDA
jgi:hypothetical protein